MRKRQTIKLQATVQITALEKLERMVKKIMASLEELNAKIAELSARVDADVEQGAATILAVRELLARIPASPDYQAQVDALNEIITKITSDNSAIQAAIDAANSTNP